MSVLVIAQEGDPHTEAVVDEVRKLDAEAVVLDLSRFPVDAHLNLAYGCCGKRWFEITVADESYDLGAFRSAWWRRPQHPRISPDITDPTHRRFAENETAEALAGLWHALEVFWVNDPALDHVAHRKVMQLRVAQQCGLRVPDTLITNDTARARLFVDRHGYRDVVYKCFSAFEHEWRETRVLRADELTLLDHVEYAPVIFQEYIRAEYDVRVTVIGDDVFAAAIHSQQTSYPVDFRMEMDQAEIVPEELPADVTAQLIAFQRALGLQYGAIDLRRRPDGTYVFLEVNPAGQFLFIERRTNQPIAAALARLLVAPGTGSNEQGRVQAGAAGR